MSSSRRRVPAPKNITSPEAVWRALKPRAQALRQRSTTAEAILWDRLRGRALAGLKFRRQHVILGIIVDYVCLEHTLVVEVDGGYHTDPQQAAQDAQRDATLRAQGYTVVRVTNEAIFSDIDAVLATLLAATRRA